MSEIKGKIFIVDDEEVLMELYASYSEALGYTPIAVADGYKALRTFDVECGLVVTDFNYDGRDKFLESISGKYPILLVTGRSPKHPDIANLRTRIEINEVLQKPPSMREFMDAVERNYRNPRTQPQSR